MDDLEEVHDSNPLRSSIGRLPEFFARSAGVPRSYRVKSDERARIVAQNRLNTERDLNEAKDIVRRYRHCRETLPPHLREALDQLRYELAMSRDAAYYASKRRSARLRDAMPVWADIEAINEIYDECDRANEGAGMIAYHVDHIIPLQGTKVSGLHVATNLRIIEKRENLKKGNRFDETLLCA